MVETTQYKCRGCTNDEFTVAVDDEGNVFAIKCTYCERTYLP